MGRTRTEREAEMDGGCISEKGRKDKRNNGDMEGKVSLARVWLKPLQLRIKDSRIRIN